MMKAWLRYPYTIFVLLIFLATLIIALPLFLLCVILPVSIRAKALHAFFKTWSYLFFTLIGDSIKIIGKSKINPNKRFVVVANHQSFLDIPMIFATLPFYVKPLARSDYGKIPFFGFIYRNATVPVDRASLSSKRDSYKKMREVMEKEHTNIFIFPEGSFNETEEILKPFFDGAFRIAKETETEILPLIFPDTCKRWHYSSFWAWSPGISRSFVLDPIPIETINNLSTKDLNHFVFEKMERAYKSLKIKKEIGY